jgi:hypothetical protein
MIQPAHAHHSIGAFKKSKYIGFFDVDEYINPQTETINLHLLLDEKCKNGGYSIVPKTFTNYYNIPENDFEFLKVVNCHDFVRSDHPVWRGDKMFVCPKNASTYCIHWLTTEGVGTSFVDPRYIYINHYKFLNKHSRSREFAPNIDNSIFRLISFLEKEDPTNP